MPAPSPGLNFVPRWRTMISPPRTVWPANTFTPRRLAFESRPLRLEPSPFLCAISALLVRRRPRAPAGDLDARHLDAGQLLAVARAALVAALGLELEHAQLRAALVTDHLGLDLDLAEVVAEQRLVAGVQERLELELGALVAAQALHEQGRALLDAVLLTAGLDDCVGHGFRSLVAGRFRRLGSRLGARTAPPASAAAAPRLRFYRVAVAGGLRGLLGGLLGLRRAAVVAAAARAA